jgi:hypothetical protein
MTIQARAKSAARIQAWTARTGRPWVSTTVSAQSALPGERPHTASDTP